MNLGDVALPLVLAFGCTAPPAPAASDAERARVVSTATASPAPSASSVEAAPMATASATASAAEAAAPDADTELPPGFVQGPTGDGEHVRCGELDLVSMADPALRGIPFVRVTDEQGNKIYEAHGRRMEWEPGNTTRQWMSIGWCGDITGDGVPELYLSESTMGAHCCYTYYLVSMTRPTKTLLMWEKGDGGMDLTPKKLREGSVYQVLSWDMVMPPFDPEKGDPAIGGYAGIPFYPIIFDLVGGQYRPKTLSFKAALEDMRRANREACVKNQDCDDYVFLDWGYTLMIGDWATERARVTDPELSRVFDKHAKAMTARLTKQLGR